MQIGDIIWLKHTGEAAEIIAILGMGMVKVKILESQIEIPVFEEDLSSVSIQIERQSEQAPTASSGPASILQFKMDPSQCGCFIAFIPLFDKSQEMKGLQAFLINNTLLPFHYQWQVSLDNNTPKTNGFLNSGAVIQLDQYPIDALNDGPRFKFSFNYQATDGAQLFQEKEWKPKASTLFKRLDFAPLLDKQAYIVRLFEELEAKGDSPEDLNEYAKTAAKSRQSFASQPDEKPVHQPDVQTYAEFPDEIDLHIELLHKNAQKLSDGEKLHLQLRTFESYLNKAIQMGLPRIFVIHGIGKGRLKSEITQRLQYHPFVKEFRNEYHPKYGYGATEIFL